MTSDEKVDFAQLQVDADAVHCYLVRHNLRAVPGNYDGQGLYGLPATMNGAGYERKTFTRAPDALTLHDRCTHGETLGEHCVIPWRGP